MIKKIIYMVLNIYFLIQASSLEASFFKTFDFEEVRKAGGFQAPILQYADEIIPAGTPLSMQEKQQIIESEQLKHLRTLDLANQGLDDEFIAELCYNSSLRRIINLNLSENKNITYSSIRSILESDILGSIRDLPQISGRYGLPCSTIYVKAKGTGVVPEAKYPTKQGYNYFEQHRFGFEIEYFRSTYEELRSSDPVAGAIKFIQVILG